MAVSCIGGWNRSNRRKAKRKTCGKSLTNFFFCYYYYFLIYVGFIFFYFFHFLLFIFFSGFCWVFLLFFYFFVLFCLCFFVCDFFVSQCICTDSNTTIIYTIFRLNHFRYHILLIIASITWYRYRLYDNTNNTWLCTQWSNQSQMSWYFRPNFQYTLAINIASYAMLSLVSYSDYRFIISEIHSCNLNV